MAEKTRANTRFLTLVPSPSISSYFLFHALQAGPLRKAAALRILKAAFKISGSVKDSDSHDRPFQGDDWLHP
jgi:hypothetical protein